MAKPPVVTNGYQKLLSTLRLEVARGIKSAEKLLEQQKVRTYWTVGRTINAYLTSAPLERGDIGVFYRRLAGDLNISDRTLQQTEQFYRYFPKSIPKHNLSWSQYRALLVVPDEKDREQWIRNIAREKWSSRDLSVRIADALGLSGADAQPIDPGKPARGRLWTYKLVKTLDTGHSTLGTERRRQANGQPDKCQVSSVQCPSWFVDIGFTNRVEAPPCDGTLDNKYLVSSVKNDDSTYRLVFSKATVDELYTYQARVQRVVDGDTLVALIDQGFGIWTSQKLRLKGLDAPESETIAGKKAKLWVEEALDEAEFVIIRTSKSDMYGRYLADVFFMPGEANPGKVAAQGRWLNGELLANGLAGVWK